MHSAVIVSLSPLYLRPVNASRSVPSQSANTTRQSRLCSTARPSSSAKLLSPLRFYTIPLSLSLVLSSQRGWRVSSRERNALDFHSTRSTPRTLNPFDSIHPEREKERETSVCQYHEIVEYNHRLINNRDGNWDGCISTQFQNPLLLHLSNPRFESAVVWNCNTRWTARLCLQEGGNDRHHSKRTITIFALPPLGIQFRSEIGNEAKRSSSGACKGYDDTSYQRQYISIFLLHSLSFQNFQALYFFLSFFSLRFEEEGISKRKFLPPWIRLHENDAQPIKIPSGRSSSIFPTRCRLTSAGRIKFQPRSVAGVIVSAFTHHGTEELILRFDRGNKIRNGGSTPTSTSSNNITITVATLFSRRKVDSSGKMDWLTSIKHDRGLDGFSPGLKIN